MNKQLSAQWGSAIINALTPTTIPPRSTLAQNLAEQQYKDQQTQNIFQHNSTSATTPSTTTTGVKATNTSDGAVGTPVTNFTNQPRDHNVEGYNSTTDTIIDYRTGISYPVQQLGEKGTQAVAAANTAYRSAATQNTVAPTTATQTNVSPTTTITQVSNGVPGTGTTITSTSPAQSNVLESAKPVVATDAPLEQLQQQATQMQNGTIVLGAELFGQSPIQFQQKSSRTAQNYRLNQTLKIQAKKGAKRLLSSTGYDPNDESTWDEDEKRRAKLLRDGVKRAHETEKWLWDKGESYISNPANLVEDVGEAVSFITGGNFLSSFTGAGAAETGAVLGSEVLGTAAGVLSGVAEGVVAVEAVSAGASVLMDGIERLTGVDSGTAINSALRNLEQVDNVIPGFHPFAIEKSVLDGVARFHESGIKGMFKQGGELLGKAEHALAEAPSIFGKVAGAVSSFFGNGGL